jgi:hypothetical protein
MIKSSKGEHKEKNTGDGEKYIYACGGKKPGIRPMLGPDGKPIKEYEEEDEEEED